MQRAPGGRGGGPAAVLESRGQEGRQRPKPHLPVRHRLAFELAVGVGPQPRQLLLAGESPVPLLATVVVHSPAPGRAQQVGRKRPQSHHDVGGSTQPRTAAGVGLAGAGACTSRSRGNSVRTRASGAR